MELGRLLRLFTSFYRMYAMPSLVVSFLCGLIMYTYALKSGGVIGVIIVATFWFKVATMVLFYFSVKRSKWKEFYYYKNVGVPRSWLWGMTLTFDFLTYIASLIIAFKIR